MEATSAAGLMMMRPRSVVGAGGEELRKLEWKIRKSARCRGFSAMTKENYANERFRAIKTNLDSVILPSSSPPSTILLASSFAFHFSFVSVHCEVLQFHFAPCAFFSLLPTQINGGFDTYFRLRLSRSPSTPSAIHVPNPFGEARATVELSSATTTTKRRTKTKEKKNEFHANGNKNESFSE